MVGHIAHFTVVTGGEPLLQALFMLAQIDSGNAQLLKAQFFCPAVQLGA